MRIVGAVPRIAAGDAMPRNAPFVIHRGASAWPATQWTRESVQQKIVGDLQLDGYRGSSPLLDGLPGSTTSMQMSLRSFVDWTFDDAPATEWFAQDGAPVKLQWPGGRRDEHLGALLDDIRLPSFIDPTTISSVVLWLSRDTYVNALHYDMNGCGNLNTQVQGSKRVLLFAPEEARRCELDLLIDKPDEIFAGGCITPFDASVDDPQRRFHDAGALEAVLEPGDMLYIPPFWLHLFFHLAPRNVNVTVWWNPSEVALSPISARWAFHNALADALRVDRPDLQIDHLAAAVEALGPEARQLLARIERALLEHPECLSTASWMKDRMPLGIDE